MRKSDRLKQIYKELISINFTSYWQKTGVNDRLAKYQRIQNLVEYIVIALDIFMYLWCLFIFKDLIVSLLEESGYLFEKFTRAELIEAVSITMFNLAISLAILYMGFVFLMCVANRCLFRYELIKAFKMLLCFYLSLIIIMFSLDFFMETYFVLVILLLIRYVLNLFIKRVYAMNDFATGKIRKVKLVCEQEGIGIKQCTKES